MKKINNLMKCVATLVVSILFFSQCSEEEKPESKNPIITSFSPTSIEPGAELTIVGSKFGEDVENLNIHLHGATQSFDINARTATNDEIKAVIPITMEPGDYQVRVDVGELESEMSEAALTVVDIRPVINSFSPMSIVPGNQLTITGSRFGTSVENLDVLFADSQRSFPLEPTTVTASQIQLLVPAHVPPGTYQISVSVNGLSSASISTALTVEDVRPIITSFTPSNVNVGDQITITGSRFGNTPSNVSVFFRNSTTSMRVDAQTVSDNQIQVNVPAELPSGNYGISVTVNGVSSGLATATLIIN